VKHEERICKEKSVSELSLSSIYIIIVIIPVLCVYITIE
jgi:hypothetical protein